MANPSSVVYYPKLDGFEEGLQGLEKGLADFQSGLQVVNNSACILTIQASSNDGQTLSSVQVSTGVQADSQTNAEIQKERYRVLFFNWTNDVYQSLTNAIACLGLIISGIFLLVGQFSAVLDPVIWRYSLTVVPILHAITCVFLLLGIRYKKHGFYVVYLVLNFVILIGSIFFSILLLVAAENNDWYPVYLFFAILHLLLCFPHFSAIMIVRTADELMQLKPLVNIKMVNNNI